MDWTAAAEALLRVGFAFLLAFPIGWERGKGRASVGFRTLPTVAMAACGFALIAETLPGASGETVARVMQGIITGIGFIGGGAILKRGDHVEGLVTAASIWNAGAIGIAIAYSREEVAVLLAAINFLTLLCLSPIVEDDGENDKD